MTEQTLYEKYGGFSNVSKIVFAFYDTLLDDDDIGPFFDDIDMAKMVDHQTKTSPVKVRHSDARGVGGRLRV